MAEETSNNNPIVLKLKCKYCIDSYLIDDEHTGDTICNRCGVVVGDRIVNDSSEWRSFGNDEKNRSRVGGAEDPYLQSSGLQTRIEHIPGSSYIDKQRHSLKDQQLRSYFQIIEDISGQIHLPDIVQNRVKHYIKELSCNEKFKHNDKLAVTTACIMASCETEGVPRTLKELCSVTRMKKRTLQRHWTSIKMILDLKCSLKTPADYIPRYVSCLGFEKEKEIAIQKEALSLAHKVSNDGLISDVGTPITVAVVIIYHVTKAYYNRDLAQNICVKTGSSISLIEKTAAKAMSLFKKLEN